MTAAADEWVLTPRIARQVRIDLELEYRDAVRAGEEVPLPSGVMPVGWRPPSRQLEIALCSEPAALAGGSGDPPTHAGAAGPTPAGEARPCRTCGATPTRLYVGRPEPEWLCEAHGRDRVTAALAALRESRGTR